ncbi:hypothetical protein FQR65_LT07405 [Abscondita terminalis]|nr:hypothetical protein FQR65_LT07405 [Abscondita terminalis]
MSEKDPDSLQNFGTFWDYSIELECLQGTQDLQLAAELGKTLLERNKELETSLKQHQNVIDDQSQEIEYLRKQTVALREVNDSRLRIYEQLEVSIQDLERANHRLVIESSSDKKHLKSLIANIESLELKCEELQGVIDDLNLQLESYKRRLSKTPEPVVVTKVVNLRRIVEYDEIADSPNLSHSPKKETEKPTKNLSQTPIDVSQKSAQSNTLATVENVIEEKDDSEDKHVMHLMAQLRENQTLLLREQRRVTELEEHLATMVQQNQSLENQLLHIHLKDEESKSMHEELMTLEEVRQGQLCSRCLRTIDSPRTGDNMSCLGDEPEDDDASMLEALMNNSTHRSSFSMDIQETKSPRQESNLYRDLIEKYEALLEVQRTQSLRNQKSNNLSLQEEMQMSGNFNSVKDTDEESGHGDSLQPEHQIKKHPKPISRTPTDFSEAETSSSGFSDETSNKATQTDDRPGSFLCTIADGEDCKFSIYDDASPVDSRFRNRPEYRELFSEIFTVLKKAAENKDEGEELPLLDDLHTKNFPNVPPVTPAIEELPDFSDDTQSVLSSTVSEISTNQTEATTVIENIENKIPEVPTKTEEPVLTPYIREPLEYLQVSVNVRKRSSSRRKKQLAERSGSPATPILGSPKITYTNRQPSGRRRRDIKAPLTDLNHSWTGNTMQFYSRKVSPAPGLNTNRNSLYENNLEYKPSTASKDLFKLKRLDLSYAEVLRNADNKKAEPATRQRRKQ